MVPLCNEPVKYVSLDILMDENVEHMAPHSLLPIAEGAMWSPKLLEAKKRKEAAKAAHRLQLVTGETPRGAVSD